MCYLHLSVFVPKAFLAQIIAILGVFLSELMVCLDRYLKGFSDKL